MKAVILAGGTGTRLWPLSRKDSPKQLHKLLSDKTMLQETIDRLSFLDKSDIFIATNEKYEKETRRIAKTIPKNHFIIEPALRDTAPCIGLAATYVKKYYGEDEVMAIIYADQYIKNEKEFKKALKLASSLAKKEGTVNIVEVKAHFPNTNLGYVQIGKKIEGDNKIGVYEFEKFVEKPTILTAKKYVEDKKHVWNTGIYVWPVKTILEKYKNHQPKTYKELEKIEENIGTKKEKKALKEHYPLCEKISLDYAIMEKLKGPEVKIIVADLGWNDIGTWESIHDELTLYAEHNLIRANHVGIDTEGCIIHSEDSKKLIATVGVEDLAIIDTGDALLVCNKRKAKKMKELVETLKKKNPEIL